MSTPEGLGEGLRTQFGSFSSTLGRVEIGGLDAQGLILFHGAGGDRDHALFKQLEQELDIEVARVNFPFRAKGPGRRPPDRMPVLLQAVQDASTKYAKKWKLDPAQIVLGGRSMGGRVASMAVADGLGAAGLLLLSYPLHPPGKPDKLRVEHWPDVTCPVLLAQAVSDPFGKPDEFAEHLPTMNAPVTEVWLPTGGHDPKKHHDAIVEAATQWLAG